jgi:hypothetical protein
MTRDEMDAAISKLCAGRISTEIFHAVVRDAVRRELAILREKVNRDSEKEVNHVRTW